jgi:hypothetical protein
MSPTPHVECSPWNEEAGMDHTRSGGCSCGAVRFQVRGDPVRTGVCHCTTCRKETGSVIMAFAVWPKDSFEVTGKTRGWKNRQFCPACGSRLFEASDESDEVEIKLGSLDDAPTGLAPVYELWTKRREPWLDPISGTTQYPENRRP